MNPWEREELVVEELRHQNAIAARKKLIPLFCLTTFLGGAFTVGLVASWVAFLFAGGNSGCAAVCTLFGIFCVPLFVGSIQALCGRPSGLRLMKFGSLVFIFETDWLIEIWSLGGSAEYKFYLEWLTNRSR